MLLKVRPLESIILSWTEAWSRLAFLSINLLTFLFLVVSVGSRKLLRANSNLGRGPSRAVSF
jgi:hypothetical protein